MSKTIKQEKHPIDEADVEVIRVRGVGNPESHSQDADRHHKTKHQKSEQQKGKCYKISPSTAFDNPLIIGHKNANNSH